MPFYDFFILFPVKNVNVTQKRGVVTEKLGFVTHLKLKEAFSSKMKIVQKQPPADSCEFQAHTARSTVSHFRSRKSNSARTQRHSYEVNTTRVQKGNIHFDEFTRTCTTTQDDFPLEQRS